MDESHFAEIRRFFREEKVKQEKFKVDLAREFGVENNPKLDLCFTLEWEHGHAYGFHEVRNYFIDFVELIKN